MLPEVDADDGGVAEEGVLVSGRHGLELLGSRVESLRINGTPSAPSPPRQLRGTHEPSPSGALDSESVGVDRLLELLDRTKVGLDGIGERAGLGESSSSSLDGG